MTSSLAVVTSSVAVLLLATCGVMTSPTNVTCIHGNATYTLGQQYTLDACTKCRCSDDGRPDCVVEDCAPPASVSGRRNCRRAVIRDGECCARCDEPGCMYRGRFYTVGEVSNTPLSSVKINNSVTVNFSPKESSTSLECLAI